MAADDFLIVDDPRDGDDLSPDAVAALDSSGLIETIIGLGEQLSDGWTAAREALEPFSRTLAASGFDRIAVCGMGGSAIGGDIVAAAVPSFSAPFVTVRGYALPGWAFSHTLIVAVSYSGNTEETLSCVRGAIEHGSRPVCVTSGGTLAELAAAHDLPLVTVPGGLQPRAALGHLTAAVAAAVDASCLVGGLGGQVSEAAHLLCNMATIFDPEIAVPTNRAKGLAARLHKRLPLIYGAGLTTVAARRWKCEINENAEMPVFWAELPELDHNELAGWTIVPKGVEVVVVALDDPLGDPRLTRRMDATLDIIGSCVADVVRVSARGESPLARVLSSAYIGDAVSFYLAIMNGVDPAPVSAIERLKASLADDPAGE